MRNTNKHYKKSYFPKGEFRKPIWYDPYRKSVIFPSDRIIYKISVFKAKCHKCKKYMCPFRNSPDRISVRIVNTSTGAQVVGCGLSRLKAIENAWGILAQKQRR